MMGSPRLRGAKAREPIGRMTVKHDTVYRISYIVLLLAVVLFAAACSKDRGAPAPIRIGETELAASAFSRGSDKAPVTLVVFSEFLCPFCARFDADVEKLVKELGEENIRVVFQAKIIHGPAAEYLHRAAIAAGLQGKFWEFASELFSTQDEWSRQVRQAFAQQGDQAAMEQQAFTAVVEPKAKKLGLDIERLKTDMASETVVNQMKAENDLGKQLGVSSTPCSFINGKKLQGAVPYKKLRRAVRKAQK